MTTKNATFIEGPIGPLDHTFTAPLTGGTEPGAWTCIVTDWTPTFFGTRGLVKDRVGSRPAWLVGLVATTSAARDRRAPEP